MPLPACEDDLAARGLTEAPQSFGSDSLWNYEVGLKTLLAGGRLGMNLAAYQVDWEDAPLSVPNSCGFSFVINGGELDITGFEADIDVQFSDRWSGRFGLAYTNSELAEDTPLLGGVKGDRTPHIPEWQYSLILDYQAPFFNTNNQGFMHFDYQYVDEKFRTFGTPTDERLHLDSYDLVGIRAGIIADRWQLDAYVDNVTNERVELNKANQSFAEFPGLAVFTNRPRTYGLRFTTWF